jgi:endonuclease/exonuclease/phosphatase family metal-dependent hydrolase
MYIGKYNMDMVLTLAPQPQIAHRALSLRGVLHAMPRRIALTGLVSKSCFTKLALNVFHLNLIALNSNGFGNTSVSP